MPESPIAHEYEGGVPVFRPSYEEFKEFHTFVNKIEPIGMTTGIVKIVPPSEWTDSLPQIPTAAIDQIDIRNPIEQHITMNGGRGVFGVDNIEKRKKYSMKQWIKQCNLLSNQPPTKRGEPQRILGNYIANPGGFISYDDSDYTPSATEDLEAKFWKGLAYGGAPMYGADLPGSLFTDSTKDWNVANLDSLLSVLPNKIPGVNDAYLYCGMWKSVFSWHLEDVDLPSINYIHFGAPKQWYSIPQAYHERFYDLMTALWPDEQEKCSEFLRHKTFFVEPSFIEKHGIPVNKIVHRQREFMITFPFGYHAGFNYGFNVAESVNFAHDSWLDIGAKAQKCQCVSHSVGIDVQQLIDSIKQGLPEGHERKLAGPAKPSFAGHRLGQCVLCPHIFNNQYVSNRAGTARAHITCANLVTETWISGRTVHGLETIPKDRFKLKCAYCKLSLGCCFQCSVPQCTRSYHGSCAAAAGAEYHNPHWPLCQYHRTSDHQEVGYHEKLAFHINSLLVGDIVQYKRGNKYGAGLVARTGPQLELKSLPNPDTSITVNPEEVVDVFEDRKYGPYIEPLQPLKKRRISEKRVNTPESPETKPLPMPTQQLQSPPEESK